MPVSLDNRSGFPKGRCSALIGTRGALKSHLAYYTLLHALQEDENSLGIMLSLRDDEEAVIRVLETICEQQRIPKEKVRQWAYGSPRKLEIVYFWPGYIPPAEFMHRVVVATQGQIKTHNRKDGRDVIAILNGIDHLNARHPLCAREEMFIPAIVSYFKQHSSTLLVIAASDSDQNTAASSLAPMADLILEFQSCVQRPSSLDSTAKQIVEITAQRVPAGGTSGGRGYLYRDSRANGSIAFRIKDGDNR